MEIEEVVRQHLQTGRMMQLATSVNNQPWCCTVFFVPDDEFNLYWISKSETRHSKELIINTKAAVAIPIKFAVEGKRVGLQIEGEAKVVEEIEEIKRGARLFSDRYQTGEIWYTDFVAGKNEHKLYKFRSKIFGVFDQENFPKSGRMEWMP